MISSLQTRHNINAYFLGIPSFAISLLLAPTEFRFHILAASVVFVVTLAFFNSIDKAEMELEDLGEFRFILTSLALVLMSLYIASGLLVSHLIYSHGSTPTLVFTGILVALGQFFVILSLIFKVLIELLFTG